MVLDDTYDYDNNGNVAGITDGLPLQPGNRDMSYDALDRLVGVTAGSAQGGNGIFAYDPLDNIRQLDQGTRTGRHQYDAVTNRLTALKNAAGTTLSSYGHDARGNLITRTEGGQTYTFTFDTANRLTATTLGASSYEYDGLGRRTRETSGGLATYYQYSRAGQLLYAEDYKTARSNLYIYLSGSLVAKRTLAHATGALQYSYQHTDALGSLVAATNASGAVQRRERMTAHGEPVDGAWDNGHGFTGHQNDAATKLVYMQQRYYDPVVGRFLSKDPVHPDMNSGVNFSRYWYANNNSFSFVDPDGRFSSPCVGRICGQYTDSGTAGFGCERTCVGKDSQPKAKRKSLTGTAGAKSKADLTAIAESNSAIDRARIRVDRSGDAGMIADWNATEWRWDPGNAAFVNDPKIAAFRDPTIPMTLFVGRRFAEFADSSTGFEYHNASFTGGSAAMTFVALHEFGHVYTRAQTGSPAFREKIANEFAYGRMHHTVRKEITCGGCK
ncbi:MAG TPA: RHS repeat-associated core domain-containing protein [Arenimonas sp.]